MSAMSFIQSQQAYSSGQADAEREFDDEEDECVSNILANNSHFQEGVLKAQEKLAQTCGALSLPADAQNSRLKIKTGFLYLFSKEASGTESYQIREQAKQTLSQNLFPRSPDFNEEDYLNVARFAVENLGDLFDVEYELGHAAEFVIALTPEDYAHIGYVSHINHFVEILDNLDLDEMTETQIATAGAGKYYNRYLANAMESYLPPLIEKVESLIKSDIEKKTLGFAAPSP
ncbi:MAG: hypothetical protein ACXW30_02305 [Micavibrio sp.]